MSSSVITIDSQFIQCLLFISIQNQTTHLFLFHSMYDHFSRHDAIYQMWLHRMGLASIISLNNLEMRRIPHKKILLQLIKGSLYTDLKMTEDIKIFSIHIHKVSLSSYCDLNFSSVYLHDSLYFSNLVTTYIRISNTFLIILM